MLARIASQTLIMAAELRLPTSVTDAEKRSYVDSLMATLGLTKVSGAERAYDAHESQSKNMSLNPRMPV